MLDQWLKESNYTVIFSGAGMSTESGLPDFRSANKGLWNNINPSDIASTDALNNNVEQFFQFYRERVVKIKEFAPHHGHFILADWEKKGLLQSIVTQNVDGFHQLAGSENVSELHGTLQKLHCETCKREYDNDVYLKGDYTCECGGVLRPSVVLFGEMLPEDAISNAVYESERAELMIVLGSSLTVSPANQFPLIAKQNGAKLVIVNQDETPLDQFADLIINDQRIGDYLDQIDKKLTEE